MRQLEYLNGVAGVAPGGVSTLSCPRDRRYHSLKNFLSGYIASDPAGAPTVFDQLTTNPLDLVENVTLNVNGVDIWDLTPEDIIKLAKSDAPGETFDDELPFFFSQPSRASVVGEEATSWDMFGQANFTQIIKWKKNIANPQVSTVASFDYGRNIADGRFFLNIVKRSSYTWNVPAGAFDATALPIDKPIMRLHIEPSAGAVSKTVVTRDAAIVHELDKAHNDKFLKDYGIVSPFGYTVAFNHEQQITSPLIVNKALNVRTTFSEANSAKFIIEQIARGYV